MTTTKTLHAFNGQTRGDGYDAHMRPTTRRDNAPGGTTHVVTYIHVSDGHRRILYCDSEMEARNATLYGPAYDGELVNA